MHSFMEGSRMVKNQGGDQAVFVNLRRDKGIVGATQNELTNLKYIGFSLYISCILDNQPTSWHSAQAKADE